MEEEANDMLGDDYNFSKGKREKYRHYNGQARTLRVRHPDGSVTVETVWPDIELEPDVRRHFPDSEAVNKVLRGLIELIPDDKPPNSAP